MVWYPDHECSNETTNLFNGCSFLFNRILITNSTLKFKILDFIYVSFLMTNLPILRVFEQNRRHAQMSQN